METNTNFYFAARSSEELTEYIDNRQKYLPESVEAAVAELQHRGHQFSDEELKVIHEDMQARRNNAATIGSTVGLFNNDYENAIVEDPAAPLLYSRRVLYVFTFLVGAMFGSVMMAMNLGKVGKALNAFSVILFGITFTAVQVYVISTFASPGSGSTYSVIGGIVAAYILDMVFWKQFIGNATFYRARSFVPPLIVAIVIIGLLFLAIIYGGQA